MSEGSKYVESQDRTTTKMEDALIGVSDSLSALGDSVTRLEDRLSTVTNNYPVAEDPQVSPKEAPTADSELLLETYRIAASVKHQTLRLQALISRLDI